VPSQKSHIVADDIDVYVLQLHFCHCGDISHTMTFPPKSWIK